MKELHKDNLLQFLNYYHYFHDSFITKINYDVRRDTIELLVDVYWSGEPLKKATGYFETNKTKMKIKFINIKEFKCKEIFQWDHINNAFFDYIKLDNKEFICFSN